MDIRYEVDGHKLTELPEGYAPHYIPEGFSYNENNSFAMGNETIFDYENKEGHFIQITIRIAENASLTSMDTEHISAPLRTETATQCIGLPTASSTNCISALL